MPAASASASCRSPRPSRWRERRMGRAWRGGSRSGCQRADWRGGTLISNGKGKDKSDEETRNRNRSRGGIDWGICPWLAWRTASWRIPSPAADPSRMARRLPPLPRRVLGTWWTLLLAGLRRRSCRRRGRIDLGASLLLRDGGCRTGYHCCDDADGRSTAGRRAAATGRGSAADSRPTTRRPASAGLG